MNHKAKLSMRSKRKLISSLLLIFALVLQNSVVVQAADFSDLEDPRTKRILEAFKPGSSPVVKGGVTYVVREEPQLKLRVTRIPTEFDLLARDWDGDVEVPEEGSIVMAESIEDFYIHGEDDQIYVLPAGTKFSARVVYIAPEKLFQKDGYVELEFFEFEIPAVLNPRQIKSKMEFERVQASTDKSHTISSKAKKMGAAALMAVGGAVAAPLLVSKMFGISGKIASITSGSAPYILGGAAILGGGIGLAYGLSRKGKMQRLEPGTDFELELKEGWKLSIKDGLPTLAEYKDAGYQFDADHGLSKRQKLYNECLDKKICKDSKQSPVAIQIKKVKKTTDVYGSRALKVTFDYQNYREDRLRYSCFRLIDSMGRSYEVTPGRIEDDIIGTVPNHGSLTLTFPTEFYKTVHYLQAVDFYTETVFASAKVVLED